MADIYVPLMNLPSKYLVYKDIPIGGIAVRELKGKDEELLAEINSTNIEAKFCKLLDNVLSGIKGEDLTLGDRMFILLHLSITTYGTTWPIEYVCGHCFQRNFMDVDLNSFDVKTLDADFVEPASIEISGEKVINVRLWRVRDEIATTAMVEKSGKVSPLYKYALAVVDESKSVEERIKILEELPMKDLAKIKFWHAKFEHGPIMEFKYKCQQGQCGGEGINPLRFQLSMVRRSGQELGNIYG